MSFKIQLYMYNLLNIKVLYSKRISLTVKGMLLLITMSNIFNLVFFYIQLIVLKRSNNRTVK